MKLSNKWYDALKFVALIALPALGTAVAGLGVLWHWAQTNEIVSSIMVVDTFLGALLGVSTAKYNKSTDDLAGYIHSTGLNEDTGLADMQLYVRKHPDEILSGKKAVFKIGPPPEGPIVTKPEMGEGE